jgi:spermidine synthase
MVTRMATIAGDAAAQPAQAHRTALPFRPVVALFVVSGAAGLIDQVCFSKYLSYVVGSTAYAVSAVLAAFMAGLALGAHLGGKLSLRLRRPVVAYAVLELVVAAAVIATPLSFEALTSVYAALARRIPQSLTMLSVLRWFVALAIVIVPTTAMGATLPILTRALADRPPGGRERQLGALYAANTVGGAAGALLAAYALLPALGLSGALLLAALLSAAVGVAALAIGWRITVPAIEPEPEPAGDRDRAPPGATMARASVASLITFAFLSGALVFAAEVVFTHLLALLVGNSAYAFGLILAVFLSCLFAGASWSGAFGERFGSRALAFGLLGTALALTVTLPSWDQLPGLFARAGGHVTSFAGREAVRAVVAFLILVLPTTLMGLTFPLLLRQIAGAPQASRWVGRLTAANTIGAVVGALATGYVIIPRLGSERSLWLVAFLFASAAIGAAARDRSRTRTGVIGAALLVLLAPLVLPRWNLPRMTGGSNVYFELWREPDEIPFVREDVHGGVTTVVRTGDTLVMKTNGKFQGDNGKEMHAQRLFAHYPSLFVSRFERALVVGLGTGTTLGTVAAYPWRQIDVVEIAPAIVEAARRYFAEGNRGALDDPRVTIHHADGRNHLLVDETRYDLISMELSSIWFAGASNLYSREFYRLVRDRLQPRGIFEQWVQLHHVTRRDLATVMATLRGEFPHVALFYGGGQGIMVASQQPLGASAARLAELEARATVRQLLPDGRGLADLTADVLVFDASLDAFLDDTARLAGVARDELVSTDQNLYLEYATPRGNVLPWSTVAELIADLRRHRDPDGARALRVP